MNKNFNMQYVNNNTNINTINTNNTNNTNINTNNKCKINK